MATDSDLDAAVRRVLGELLAEGAPYTGLPLVNPSTSLLPDSIVDAIRAPLEDGITDLDEAVGTLTPAVADLEELTTSGRLSEAQQLATYVHYSLSVKKYGAKGDGVTNDAPAINAALLAARQMTAADPNIFVSVFIPEGRYRCEEGLTLITPGEYRIQRVAVIGAGRGATTLLPIGAVQGFQDTGTGLGLSASPNVYHYEHLYFEDFTMDCRGQSTVDSATRKAWQGQGYFDCHWSRIEVIGTPGSSIGTDFMVDCSFDDVHVKESGRGINLPAGYDQPVELGTWISWTHAPICSIPDNHPPDGRLSRSDGWVAATITRAMASRLNAPSRKTTSSSAQEGTTEETIGSSASGSWIIASTSARRRAAVTFSTAYSTSRIMRSAPDRTVRGRDAFGRCGEAPEPLASR